MVKLEVNPEGTVQFTNSYQYFQSSRIFLYNASSCRVVFKMCTTRDDRFTFLPEGGFIEAQRGKTVTVFFKAKREEKMESGNCYCSILAKELPNVQMTSMFWENLISNDEGERFPLKITFENKPSWGLLSPTGSNKPEYNSSESTSSEDYSSDEPMLRNEKAILSLNETTTVNQKRGSDSDETQPLMKEEPSTSAASLASPIHPNASDCLVTSSKCQQEMREMRYSPPECHSADLKPNFGVSEKDLGTDSTSSQEGAKGGASWIEGDYDFADDYYF